MCSRSSGERVRGKGEAGKMEVCSMTCKRLWQGSSGFQTFPPVSHFLPALPGFKLFGGGNKSGMTPNYLAKSIESHFLYKARLHYIMVLNKGQAHFQSTFLSGVLGISSSFLCAVWEGATDQINGEVTVPFLAQTGAKPLGADFIYIWLTATSCFPGALMSISRESLRPLA